MSWGMFNAACPCCNDLCYPSIYPVTYYDPFYDPYGQPYHTIDLYDESNYYYALNVQEGDNYFNEHTGLTSEYIQGNLMMPVWKRNCSGNGLNCPGIYGERGNGYHYVGKPWEIGVIYLWLRGGQACLFIEPRLGYAELVEFLERGKTIVIAAEWSGCLNMVIRGTRGRDVINSMLSNLGVTGMSLVNPPDALYYGCQTVRNVAPKNTLNVGVNNFPIGGSNSIAVSGNAWSLVEGGWDDPEAILGIDKHCLAAAQVVNSNGGKVVLLADSNTLDCWDAGGLKQLEKNICENTGLEITPVYEED